MVAVVPRVTSGYGNTREGRLCLPMTCLKWKKTFPEATLDFLGSASNRLELGTMSALESVIGEGEHGTVTCLDQTSGVNWMSVHNVQWGG